MKVCIGTNNQAKVKAVKNSLGKDKNIEFATFNVSSGVSDQPFSDEETIKGAINRAMTALQEGKGEIGIGLEGGVQRTNNILFLTNWGALVLKDGTTFIASGARIPLPNEIEIELLAGRELGPVMDEFAHKDNVRSYEGAIGIFTYGRINRTSMFEHVVELLVGQMKFQQHNE
ncbi:NTPase [Niallia nealsonii AAU1]|nr:NTPase [Niallia nealsonii AAU1]